ncbi:MAG: hypothetical protein RBT52_02920 [Sulfurimonas sp.]|jgi:hypothetical protein|nr:hypothetical protein [Sulfurimonas sp.]
MYKTISFRNLWDGSMFMFANRPMKKHSVARCVDLLNGKDHILLGRDRVMPVPEKVMLRSFNLIA